MSDQKPDQDDDDAMAALRRQRTLVLTWGFFGLLSALIIGAVLAPNFTLLAFVLLVGLGAAGLAVKFAMRALDHWLLEKK